MKKADQYSTVMILTILTLIMQLSCTTNKKEEWIHSRGIVFLEGKEIYEYNESHTSGSGMSYEEYMSRHNYSQYMKPLININFGNDNTKIFKAKFKEDGETYLVGKNPDYKMGGSTSQYSHLINVRTDLIVYLQLDL